MKCYLSALAAVTVISLSASVLQADPLAPGATLFPAPVVVAPASVFVTSASGTYSAPAHFSGNVTVAVYNEGAANPLGGLTFVYSVTNNQDSPNSVERVTTDGFAGFLVNAGYVAATFLPPLPAPPFPQSSVPSYIDRSSGGGDVPGFGWFSPTGILGGTASPILVLRTNAPNFTTDTVNIIDGDSFTVQKLLGPVPEPASLTLLGTGALLLFRGRRR
jgi:hypothetical protein